MEERIFFHIDVNSAFLSWTALSLLQEGNETDLRLIPSIVGGDMAKRHGVVLAKSLPAKAYGITTGEPVVNALRKCPGLVMAAPDHAMYHRRSQELMQLLSDICPDIEQVSIDECYMDYTPIAKKYTAPEEAARQIKDLVRDTLGFTVWASLTAKCWPRWPRILKNPTWSIPFMSGKSLTKCGLCPYPPCFSAVSPVWRPCASWAY